jgi:hypothetical protein
MPVLYKVTEQQVLASAGLDAYVVSLADVYIVDISNSDPIQFLAFFKMSIKLFGVIFLITCAILAPINKRFDYLPTPRDSTDPRNPPELFSNNPIWGTWTIVADQVVQAKDGETELPKTDYLWAYLVFTYFFTGLAIYFMTAETQRIIKVRQEYLGSQSTITDRTIKLSAIPPELRSKEKIKEFLEKLEIGKVESVTICSNWKGLDDMMDKRAHIVRKIEEAWTVHLGRSKTTVIEPAHTTHPGISDENEETEGQENDTLLGGSHVTAYEKPRPTTRIWYGFLNLQNRKVDAIDYYEEYLRKLDEKIAVARKKEYTATSLAFVTMDSIPACQMAVQALLDPSPMQLLARLAPAPSDIVWSNTYLPRSSCMIRAWAITIFIIVLTIFWLIPVAGLAGLLDLCSIEQVWPGLADLLSKHDILKTLVQTGLPTLVVSLLNIAVPFLYDYLANMQGMISQGDVELSVISKNFFFTFFNVFLVFTAFGTATKFWGELQDSLKDTTRLAYNLARAVKSLAVFYINFILLQGVGLLPFRLLEFGSVSLYPILRMGAKTPRDYAELVQPPIFKYGFYLPSALLIYILCIVYSILPAGYMVLFFGLIYFVFGYYTYKYQLLYAMDHPQHATGKAWPMVCYRILVGLVVFQLVMAGVIALSKEFVPAGLVVPLIPFTLWYSYYFGRTYEPLMNFIALRSIRRESNASINIAGENAGIHATGARVRRRQSTVDEEREKFSKFINPSLTVP